MKEAIADYLPWIISVSTIYGLWITGNKNKYGWLVSGFNQTFWLVWIWSAAAWGLIPLNVFMTAISIRNFILWSRDEKNH